MHRNVKICERHTESEKRVDCLVSTVKIESSRRRHVDDNIPLRSV